MDVPKIRSILLCRNTKWTSPIRCPKSLKKVYDAINICLEEFNDELLANFVPEKDDTKPNEVVSVFGEVKLNDIPSDTTAAITQEMETVVQSISVTDPEASNTVEFIVTHLDDVLKQFGYIENKWSVYGSYKTGLGCIDSDIDLYFETI